ncbi:unnamed protein product, partial [Ectocarpus sp. 12 AP-2014]
MRPRMVVRWRAWHPSVVAAALRAISVVLATGCHLRSADTSTTVFTGNDLDRRESPLAVLRTNRSGDGTPASSSLEIFSEDLNWVSKVEEFMVVAGRPDALSIASALEQVRHVAWEGGRTLRGKHVVLLASAEDINDDGNGHQASCKLTRAVLAAARHTTNAHFVLVANGFELEPAMRETLESMLDDGEWKSFTVIEVPEFRGFSSAVNLAMETVPSNSIVAVLPMSVLLLPARTLDSSGPASTDTEHGHSDVDSAARSEGAAIDIFVAYERLKSSSPVFPSPMTLNKTKASSSSPREAKGYFGASVSEGVPNDECKHIRDRSGDGDEIEGLLVTALPSRATSDRQGDCGNGFLRFPQEKDGPRAIPLVGGVDYGKVGSKEIGAAWLGHSRGLQPPPPQSPRSPSPPPPRPRELIGKSLSEMAPIPLLVFDTETFLALGELDERFSFQGGIAEWINRAKFGRGNHDCSCGRSSWRRTGSPKETLAKPSRRTSTELPCSGINVCNVHEQEWGRHFMSSWSEPGERSVDGVHAREFTAEQQVGDELHPSVHPASRGVDHSEAGNQTVVSNCISGDGIQQPTNVADRHACDEVSLDQRNSLHWAKLEALIQADADLFFLRLLLLEQPSDLATVDKVDPARLSIAFHSEWMERAPDTVLAHGVLDRRKRFPVAAVVVVNEDISILRSSLEEVAVVVEHILVVVSTRPWHGDTKIVSATLELMNHMLQDVNSATHGKASPPKNGLHVEVGSWATETEQREYGNLLIREDPRHFFRVVVMDTDEFWHPAELAKALVVIAQHPETMVSRVLVDSYWASVRSVVFPPEERDVVWLVDPYHCVWHAFRNAECSTPVGSKHFF